MKKKPIRLTEAQIRHMVMESVNEILQEDEFEEGYNPFTKEGRKDWSNLFNAGKKGIRAGVNSAMGNYQLGRGTDDLNHAWGNFDAEARLQDIEDAKRELRIQYQDLCERAKELKAQMEKKGLATVERKPFKRSKAKADAHLGTGGGRFSTKYSAADGRIGDLAGL